MFTPVLCQLTLCLTLTLVFPPAKVYPIGIPAMYAVILWRKRELLNPRIHTAVMPEPEEPSGTSIVVANSAERAGIASSVRRVTSKAQTGTKLSPQELKELAERVTARRDNPELTPSMFLWKGFGEGSKSI